MDDSARYQLLKLLEAQPDLTQRELAQAMGVSVGKVNYCLKALLDVGLIKMENFKNSRNKAAYLYLLTPKGIEEKARVTKRFLRQKIEDYEKIRRELDELIEETSITNATSLHSKEPPS